MPETSLPTIAVLCGGLATRLRPITEKLPKSMLDMDGEPFIAWQLRLLSASGFQRVVLLCGFLGEQIQEFVGDGSSYGLEVDYSFDGPKPLGTGGALRKALPMLGKEFMTIYGDSYCPTDYRRIYRAFTVSQKLALMSALRNENKWDTSNVEYSNGLVVRYDKNKPDEKMRYIDYGVGAFNSAVFEEMPDDEAFDLAQLQTKLSQQGMLAGVEVTERFFEVGSHEGISDFRTCLPKHGATSIQQYDQSGDVK